MGLLSRAPLRVLKGCPGLDDENGRGGGGILEVYMETSWEPCPLRPEMTVQGSSGVRLREAPGQDSGGV